MPRPSARASPSTIESKTLLEIVNYPANNHNKYVFSVPAPYNIFLGEIYQVYNHGKNSWIIFNNHAVVIKEGNNNILLVYDRVHDYVDPSQIPKEIDDNITMKITPLGSTHGGRKSNRKRRSCRRKTHTKK